MMSQSTPSIPKNIKNIYVRKINSLQKFSGQNLPSFHKEKKIKKMASTTSKTEVGSSRKQRNKESARKARERKKMYIDLLEKMVERMEKWAQNGDHLLSESTQCLKGLNRQKQLRDEKKVEDIDRYLNNEGFSNQLRENLEQPEKIQGDIREVGLEIVQNIYPSLDVELPQSQEILLICDEINQQYQELQSINEQIEVCLEDSGQEKFTMEEFGKEKRLQFFRKMEIPHKVEKKRLEYNIQHTQNLWRKLDAFLALKIEE